MDMPIVELIKGLVQVRDGLALIAFLTLALLIAFRTKKVPELFFGLVRDKLTREQFAALLHRFMTLGFILFLVLAALTLASQALSSWTRADALTAEDLKSELAKTTASLDEQRHAEARYRLALDLVNQRKFDEAVASLKDSISAVPTLTAQETLVNLLRQKGDSAAASVAWEAAKATAQERGDNVAVARLEAGFETAPVIEDNGETDLIGAVTPLPKGGDKFETSVPIEPGLYICAEESGCAGYFNAFLQTGQRLQLKYRGPPYFNNPLAHLYGTNGELLVRSGQYGESEVFTADLLAATNGRRFIWVGTGKGAVFLFQVRKQ